MSATEDYAEFRPLPDAPVDTLITTALAVEPEEGYRKVKGRPQMHFSGFDRLWGCGEQFRRIYIEHERPDANVAMMVGTAVDRVVSANLETKMLDGSLMALTKIRDLSSDFMHAEWKRKAVVLSPEEKLKGADLVLGEAIDKTIRLAVLHAREIAPKIHPTHVQRLWSIEIPGFQFDLVGAIDVQEGDDTIRDTKTSGKTPAAGIADVSMQLTIYDLAKLTLDGTQAKEVVLDYLIDNKVPKAVSLHSTRDHRDHQALMNRVENGAEIIQKGAFTPAQPTDWRCSKKWCGFFDTCRYVRQPKSIVIDEGD